MIVFRRDRQIRFLVEPEASSKKDGRHSGTTFKAIGVSNTTMVDTQMSPKLGEPSF